MARTEQGEARKLELTTLEKAVVGLFSSLSLMMLGWVVVTTNRTSTELAVMKVQLEFIKERAEASGTDRYTKTDAKGDFATVSSRLDNLERRASRLESQHGLKDN